jgi:hypothetical protein
LLDALSNIIIGSGPLFGEVALGDVKDHVLDGALNQLGWRHIQGLDNVELNELLVLRGDRTLEVIVVLHVLRDVLFATIVETPGLLDLEFEVESCLGGNITRSSLVCLFNQLNRRKVSYLLSVSNHHKQSLKHPLSLRQLH